MAVLLITYDLNAPGQDYSDFYKVIKKGSWVKLSESSYAILTMKTPQDIYGELRRYMDDNDHLYIVTLKRPYFGFGPKDVNDWLASNLPG